MRPVSINSFTPARGLVDPFSPTASLSNEQFGYPQGWPGTIDDTAYPSTSAGYVPWSQDRKNGLYFLGQPNSGSPTVAYADLTTVAVGNAPVPVP